MEKKPVRVSDLEQEQIQNALLSYAKQLNLPAVPVVAESSHTVSEVFYVTVHVFSRITHILQHPCFYLLDKLIDPEFFCLPGLNVTPPEWPGDMPPYLSKSQRTLGDWRLLAAEELSPAASGSQPPLGTLSHDQTDAQIVFDLVYGTKFSVIFLHA
ncbi:hypothetical protein EXN66_Car012756 [Channa argus]|uniref:Uncharacterized protein n=1 Tax=Channa argus TaxID=215402 RepID=A0A6G1Q4G6_CHAAH|nr:hypothetical protein EXN66_Car012756 [Channa argus]